MIWKLIATALLVLGLFLFWVAALFLAAARWIDRSERERGWRGW